MPITVYEKFIDHFKEETEFWELLEVYTAEYTLTMLFGKHTKCSFERLSANRIYCMTLGLHRSQLLAVSGDVGSNPHL